MGTTNDNKDAARPWWRRAIEGTLGFLASVAVCVLALVVIRIAERSIDWLARATGLSDAATAIVHATFILAVVLHVEFRHLAKRTPTTSVILQSGSLADLTVIGSEGQSVLVSAPNARRVIEHHTHNDVRGRA